jgi:hypothetical protein
VSIRSLPLVCAVNLSTLLSPNQTFMVLDSAVTRPAVSFRAFLVGVLLADARRRRRWRPCTVLRPCVYRLLRAWLGSAPAGVLVAEARPEGRSRRPGASATAPARPADVRRRSWATTCNLQLAPHHTTDPLARTNRYSIDLAALGERRSARWSRGCGGTG